MMLFVTALFDDNGDFLECAAGEVPIWLEGASLFNKPHSSCGFIRLKDGVSPNQIRNYVEPDGNGGARFKNNIDEITTLCSRMTPATTEELREKIEAKGDAALHVVARTWLAEKLPTEKANYFGKVLKPDERALPLIRAALDRKANAHAMPTGFQAFESKVQKINKDTP